MILLKTERLRRGWSQSELARRASLNANTVSQIESQRFRPYESQLAKIARAFGIPEQQAHLLLVDAAQSPPLARRGSG